MTTSYRPPLPENRSKTDVLFVGIANAWRRQLLAYCVTPVSKADIEREFLLVGNVQIRNTIRALCDTGWLRVKNGKYQINVNTIFTLQNQVAVLFGDWLAEGETDDEAIDLALSVLRRKSCLSVLKLMADGQERTTAVICEKTGLGRDDVYRAARSFTKLGMFQEISRIGPGDREGNLYTRIKSPLLPALGGYLRSLLDSYEGQS